MTLPIVVRPTQPSDVPALLALQKRVYPTIAPWRTDQLVRQLEMFPQGQLVAVRGERLLGCASSLVILWDEWSEEHTWQEITASGTFHTHNPNGFTLYGAEVFVDPKTRGQRVGHLLYEGRRKLCKQLNLRRIIACGRLPGYQALADQMSIELYAQKVLWGDLQDPVLSFQLREGFRYCGIMSGYLPEDGESGGHASLIAWVNPLYDPSRPTGLQMQASPRQEQEGL